MGKYTTELRYVVENTEIFDFPYAFFREEEKPEFEKKFIRHFYFREIGCETVGRFKHYLQVKFDETLPYFNMLLETALFEYDLKNNYELTETFNKSKTGNKDTTGNAEQSGSNQGTAATTDNKISEFNTTITQNEDTKNDTNEISTIDDRKVDSDTPNGLLAMTNIKGNVYASKANIQDNRTETTGESTGERTATNKEVSQGSDNISSNTATTGQATASSTATQQEIDQETETYTMKREGDIGVDTTPHKLLKHIELQKILTRAYEQFFNECEDLFMQVY